MICAAVDTSGYLVQVSATDLTQCQAVLLSGVEYSALMNPDFASLGITPEQVLYVASWGFGVVILGWVFGLTAGWLAGAIKRV